jgi:hypothetical protein
MVDNMSGITIAICSSNATQPTYRLVTHPVNPSKLNVAVGEEGAAEYLYDMTH